MKPGTILLRCTRLLDQILEQVRCLHYSFSTVKAYLCAENRCERSDHPAGQAGVSAYDRPLCRGRMEVFCGAAEACRGAHKRSLEPIRREQTVPEVKRPFRIGGV